MQAARKLAEQIGDVVLQSRGLAYLPLVYCKQGHLSKPSPMCVKPLHRRRKWAISNRKNLVFVASER